MAVVKDTGCKEMLGSPRVVKDHGPGGDEVAIVYIIFGQTVWDT
jgi:hypothetical protein